jgi:HTH-type transcriptional regulator/antitoxin HigA
MKFSFVDGWGDDLPTDQGERAFAGPPSEAEDILAELYLHDVAEPELRKHTREMIQFGWLNDADRQPEEVRTQAIVTLLHGYPQSSATLLRGSLEPIQATQQKDPRLTAWLAHLNWLSLKDRFDSPYDANRMNTDSIRHVAQLSIHQDGPILAVKYLRELGVSVHVAKAIPGTRVDGCAFWSLAKRPLIGLSVRHDRLDNFWFTLLHECAHVALHVKGPNQAFADDLEVRGELDEVEIEANLVAADAAIPRAEWKRSEASKWATRSNIERVAHESGVHPSIVAGRVRFEKDDYSLFTKLLGQGEVTKLFGI